MVVVLLDFEPVSLVESVEVLSEPLPEPPEPLPEPLEPLSEPLEPLPEPSVRN